MTAASDFIGFTVRQVFDINATVVSISADFLADQVMEAIASHDTGFDKRVHSIGWFGCKQHVKQVTRGYLRHSFHPDRDDRQGEMFSETLQDRYPTKPEPNFTQGDGDQPLRPESAYVLRHHLDPTDLWWNIDQLRKSAAGRLKHANALEAETISRHGHRREQEGVA